jgi:hypothetical protein
MNINEAIEILTYHKNSSYTRNQLKDAIDKVLKYANAINEIENAMERWHHARDNDSETIDKINQSLVDIGLLGWFNK